MMKLRRFRPRPGPGAILWRALVVFIGRQIWPQVAAAFGVTSANATAPAFQLTALDGSVVSRESLRGQVVLVNFWATAAGGVR